MRALARFQDVHTLINDWTCLYS